MLSKSLTFIVILNLHIMAMPAPTVKKNPHELKRSTYTHTVIEILGKTDSTPTERNNRYAKKYRLNKKIGYEELTNQAKQLERENSALTNKALNLENSIKIITLDSTVFSS